MTRIAISGAGGFVGRRVVPRLLDDGHEVRALLRPGSKDSGLPESVHVVRGDIRSGAAVRDLIAEAEIVIHLAASFAPQDDSAEIITSGTRNAVSAAAEAGIQRIIMMSCLGADAANHSPFYAAKWRAEQLVRGSGVPFVILRPSLIVGPGDPVLRPLAGLIRLLPVIPVPGSGQTRLQPVDVEDVARCVQLSLTTDSVLGEEVSVGGPMFLTYRQIVDLVQGQIGTLKPKVPLPPGWLPPLSRVFPAGVRGLFSGPRLALLEERSGTSPGIVDSIFGFEPRSILPQLGTYIA